MTVTRTVADLLAEHTTLEVECVDRLYLNVYVPLLQTGSGVAHFLRGICGHPVPSSVLLAPRTRSFVSAIERFAEQEGMDLVGFERGERKDERTQEYLRRWSGGEGVLYIGKAQEKARVVRTSKRHDPETDRAYPWLVPSTAFVNYFYVYFMDDDFGPGFLKFCSYFPHNAKLCINGHEYLKRQLAKQGIAFEALDNGLLSCARPERLQALCDSLTAERIDALLRKWLARLPHPYAASERQAGMRYQVSILQAEFSLTQVLERPAHGRAFFEDVIRENLDPGRPDQVQLIFGRRVNKRTPSRFRTRVITQGVEPSLHIDYKHSRIKQYHKQGRALRTETTINDTYDFGVGRLLSNFDTLKRIGFSANRRLLDVQRLSHNCQVGAASFDALQSPRVAGHQRAAALRFGDARVQALLSALLVFRLLPRGFDNRQLREHLAPLLGRTPETFSQGSMSYDLRRLRLHGLIERIPKTRRYRVTDAGIRTALCLHRTYARVLRPALAAVHDSDPPSATRLQRTVATFDREVERLWEGYLLAA